MQSSEEAHELLVPDDEWEDSLLPQQVLPVPSTSAASDVFCDASEVVAAAASAVDACEDGESTGELLQPLAEAYLLAVRNEARRLPKIVCASNIGRNAPSTGSVETTSTSSLGTDRRLQHSSKSQQKASPPLSHVSDNGVFRRTAGQLTCQGPGIDDISSCRQPRSEGNHTATCSSVRDRGRVVDDRDGTTAVAHQLADEQGYYSGTPTLPAGESGESSSLPREYRTSGGKITKRRAPNEGSFEADAPTTDDGSEDMDAGGKSYVQKLLVLEKRRSAAKFSGTAPSPEWRRKSLSNFRELRDRLSHEQAAAVQAGLSQHTSGDYRNWSETEWRLYCRCYPPSSAVLAACDNVTLCRLLSLLNEDISLQRRTIIRHQCKTSAGKKDTAATLPQPEAGPSQEARCSCCRVASGHVTLQQACWLFGIFLFLDELQVS
ncbi:conserved hypothetical protein [Neospora caninum Liverpool]|uniref:Uncharacterized protein n=1 Tax=Neospora caninum (strain Liverpool) TaxID=572307 RepID=F0VF98_NEOCL|nr:conserved hypothetical protein [Neospora caninum Liverpool]CBZ52392.1 conserved hypothetical protein [Neospora caninum Liverpool]|eukprot:XP_003882424.1 conserved hypothetical protein [Neospora caninum Liverpool]